MQLRGDNRYQTQVSCCMLQTNIALGPRLYCAAIHNPAHLNLASAITDYIV